MELSVNEKTWLNCELGIVLLYNWFRLKILPSGSKSYRDFRETGPRISLKTERTRTYGKDAKHEARPPRDAMYLPKTPRAS